MIAPDPVVWFFLLGVVAGLLRAELRLPPAIYEFLVTILLLAIGIKGGIELARQPLMELMLPIVAVAAMGIVLPLLAFPVLRLGRLARADAASIAAHYGSVSVGTYAVAAAWLYGRGIPYESWMPVLLVILEIPAIIIGVLLARGLDRHIRWREMGREVLLGKSIVLLFGGLLIGWAVGEEGIEPLKPLFLDLFPGVLALFMLEMGLIAASQLGALRRSGLFLLAFGTVMPLFSGLFGALLGVQLGLSLGGTVLLATLAASASYIAVPAAMRLSVPEANPTLSLTAALGITFPFNILIGIPIYMGIAQWLQT